MNTDPVLLRFDDAPPEMVHRAVGGLVDYLLVLANTSIDELEISSLAAAELVDVIGPGFILSAEGSGNGDGLDLVLTHARGSRPELDDDALTIATTAFELVTVDDSHVRVRRSLSGSRP